MPSSPTMRRKKRSACAAVLPSSGRPARAAGSPRLPAAIAAALAGLRAQNPNQGIGGS